MIEARSITKRYGHFEAIHKLCFTIKPGEVVGLLGPNGAGKTTTMRILTGFMPPSSGRIVVAGHDLLQEPREAKKNLGYLPETPPLYPELTIEEMLTFVAGLRGIPKKQKKEKVERALERTGIQDVRKRLIGHISKGYRQRVGIAQAILHDPSFLILDEPTIGLDPKQILEIRELIQNLSKKNSVGHGRHAILLSSHILQEISMVCSRVIIIHHGKIVADGKIEDLTSSLQRKKLLVTLSKNSEALEEIRKMDGVESVADYASNLEELFINLTRET